MKKIYEKPNLEIISLITEEKLTSDSEVAVTSDDVVNGEMGLSGSIF